MINKIKALKFLDSLFGSILCECLALFSSNSKYPPISAERILVIRPGGIGDAVLLLPALKKLRELYPDSRIDVLAEKRNSQIFGLCSHINDIYEYDDLRNLQLLQVLRNGYDKVIDTEQWHRLSAVVAFLTGASERIGFGTNKRRKLFSKSVDYDQSDYEGQSFLNLVCMDGSGTLPFEHGVPFIKKNNDRIKRHNPEIDKYSGSYKKVVGIFPGATVREREWGIVSYAMLAEKLLQNGIGVVLLGGPNDITSSDIFKRILLKEEFLDLTGKTSLPETAGIISKLDLFISADTGLMHIAYGAGTSTVSLFGAGIREKWAPRGDNHLVINKKIFCSPCTKYGYTPHCPYDVRCLKLITVEEVYEKARKLLY